MNHWMRLGLPLGLGLIAALLNWVSTTAKITPFVAIRVSRDLERGNELVAECLEPLEIRGDLAELPNSAVAWKDRAILFSRPVPRALKRGDLVLWRDATPLPKELPAYRGEFPFGLSLAGMTIVPEFIQVGQQVGFLIGKAPQLRSDTAGEQKEQAKTAYEPASEYIGPFRVLAVGRRVTPGGELADTDGSRSQILTIAARFASQSQRPDLQTDRLVSATAGFGGNKILGVVLHAREAGAGSLTAQ
jgi:hypothetical protein